MSPKISKRKKYYWALQSREPKNPGTPSELRRVGNSPHYHFYNYAGEKRVEIYSPVGATTPEKIAQEVVAVLDKYQTRYHGIWELIIYERTKKWRKGRPYYTHSKEELQAVAWYRIEVDNPLMLVSGIYRNKAKIDLKRRGFGSHNYRLILDFQARDPWYAAALIRKLLAPWKKKKSLWELLGVYDE